MALSYINSQLQNDEKIIETAKIHWLINLRYIYVLILLLIGQFILALIAAIFVYFYIKSFEMAVTNKRVIAKFGIIRRKTFEINLKKVEGCNLNQDIIGRIFGYASLIVRGTGGGITPFPYVSNFEEFKRKVNEMVDISQN